MEIAPVSADLVSVIIPTYNRATLLMEALASVRQQTWPHIQIIVADDGSSDSTQDLISAMPDVLYVRQEHRGQGAARNLGLRHAKGAYICTLVSDDVWKPDFVESSLTALRTLDADFVFSNWVEETDDGERYASNFERDFDWSPYAETELTGWRLIDPVQSRTLYVRCCVSPSSALLFPRKLMADGWNEDLKIGDDWYLLLSWVLSRPCRVAVSTQTLWVKRICDDSISDMRGDKAVNRYAYIDDFKLLVQRFSAIMQRDERIRFYTLIAFSQLELCGLESRRRQFGYIPSLVVESMVFLSRALVLRPTIIGHYARKLRQRTNQTRPTQARVLSSEATEGSAN